MTQYIPLLLTASYLVIAVLIGVRPGRGHYRQGRSAVTSITSIPTEERAGGGRGALGTPAPRLFKAPGVNSLTTMPWSSGYDGPTYPD